VGSRKSCFVCLELRERVLEEAYTFVEVDDSFVVLEEVVEVVLDYDFVEPICY